jgi:hypothetical protein
MQKSSILVLGENRGSWYYLSRYETRIQERWCKRSSGMGGGSLRNFEPVSSRARQNVSQAAHVLYPLGTCFLHYSLVLLRGNSDPLQYNTCGNFISDFIYNSLSYPLRINLFL